MVKTCISPTNKLLHAASLVLMQSSYQWSCIHLFSNMLRLCQGRPSRAKPHHYIVLLCLNSAAMGIRSEYFPLWVSDLVELNHYLQVKSGSSTHPTLKSSVPVFGPTFLENFQIAGGRTLQTEVDFQCWPIAGQKCIQNFPQNNLIQTATFANMPAWQPQKPPKGGCKTRFSRFWSTQHFYVWGTWRRIAHWNPQPPSGSCELLIRIANLSRCNDSKNTELAHRGSDPKISWSDSTRETESGPIEEANHFSEVHFCLKSYRQQIGLPEDFSVLSMPLCVLIIPGSTWVGSLVIQSFYNSLLSLWCFAYCT